MATVKIKFRASSVAGKEGTLYYHIIHQRKLRWISTDYHVYPEESGMPESHLSLLATVTTGRHICNLSSRK